MKKGFAKFLLAVFHSDTFFFAVFLNRRLRTFFSGPVTERIKNYHENYQPLLCEKQIILDWDVQ